MLLGTDSLTNERRHYVSDLGLIVEVSHYKVGTYTSKFNKGVAAKSIQVHPNYSWPAAYFDVAILFLAERITFSETMSPVCLPERTEEDADSLFRALVTLTGWGMASRAQTWSNADLQRMDVAVYSQGLATYIDIGVAYTYAH